jgi:hypothetical protein
MKQYQIKLSDSFTAYGNLNHYKDINRTWENIKDNIFSAKERIVLYKRKQYRRGLMKNVRNF